MAFRCTVQKDPVEEMRGWMKEYINLSFDLMVSQMEAHRTKWSSEYRAQLQRQILEIDKKFRALLLRHGELRTPDVMKKIFRGQNRARIRALDGYKLKSLVSWAFGSAWAVHDLEFE